MSSNAKVWKDKEGWHGISDWHDKELISHDYALSDIIIAIEDQALQQLDWEIFEFKDGLGLRGYIAKP